MKYSPIQWFWGVTRLGMGWLFLWPFLDKVFGLGFATASGKGWIDGASPTLGFLKFGTKGPFAEIYQSMAGHPVVDWLFMVGLLLIGLALIAGVGVKIAGWSGALMLILMYTAGYIPPEHNPFLDDHLMYALFMIGLTLVPSGHWLGCGKKWSETKLVKKYPFLA